DVARRLPAARRVSDVDRVAKVEMNDQGGSIGRVVVHVMAIAYLRRPAVTAPIMRDDAVALVEEIEHLRVPVVGAQWPTMMENDRLGILGTPILVEDLDAIVRGDRAHCVASFLAVVVDRHGEACAKSQSATP